MPAELLFHPPQDLRSQEHEQGVFPETEEVLRRIEYGRLGSPTSDKAMGDIDRSQGQSKGTE
ncbi:hypothetical protein Hypma_010410 [Hypsizygus marmoreus]|uniref:Uncharacterized protein n=1 Tax=Hypsizygus marmoreus TaxID=39966 RepID=A0A369JRW3_HYPMA|nr:hypothetical protein Hypma_010410 [Hypsizygus marmoreus]